MLLGEARGGIKTIPSERTINTLIPHKTTETPDTISKGTEKKIKPGRPPRVAPREVRMVKQEEINHMAPTITIATHNMSTQIKDETLAWYLLN